MRIDAILLAVFWLVITPALMGGLLTKFIETPKITCGKLLAAGYLLMLASFQLITVPFVLLERTMREVVLVNGAVFGGLAIAGGYLLWKRGTGKQAVRVFQNLKYAKAWSRNLKELMTTEKEWLLFSMGAALLLGYQIYKMLAYASFDGDDAYYVAQSVAAAQDGDLYRVLPYTGHATELDTRHALAVFPLFIAFLSRVCNLHATIMSHNVVAIAFLLMTYLLWKLVGECLFQEKRDVALFFLVMEFLQIFGNVSIYTNATFFLIRTWQGKSILANLVLAALCWILLQMLKTSGEEKTALRGIWVLMFLTNMVAALATTMGVFLTAIFIGAVVFWDMVSNRSLRKLPGAICGCLPCLLYAGLYVVL